MPQWGRLALFSLSVGVPACSEPATLMGNPCQAGVMATVSQTTPPEFRWTPACDVGTIYVTTEAGEPMWQLSSEPQPISRPLTRSTAA